MAESEREERLKAQLRENLKRRKAKARQAAEQAEDEGRKTPASDPRE